MVESSVEERKEQNTDWEVNEQLWGEEFIVEVKSEGLESRGEVPQAEAQVVLYETVQSRDAFVPGDVPETASGVDWEHQREVSFVRGQNKMTVRLRAKDYGLIQSEFGNLVSGIEDRVPNSWVMQDEVEELN